MILGSGCFDGIHGGHARYISALKKLAREGEGVAVGVAPDDYIDATKHRKPRWSQLERRRAVLEMGVSAIAHPEASVAETVRSQKPRLFVKGMEWAGKLPGDVVTACHEVGALMVFVDTPGTHTTEAIG